MTLLNLPVNTAVVADGPEKTILSSSGGRESLESSAIVNATTASNEWIKSFDIFGDMISLISSSFLLKYIRRYRKFSTWHVHGSLQSL